MRKTSIYSSLLALGAVPLTLLGVAFSGAVSQPPAAGAGGDALLPPGPGREVVAQNCSICHALGLAVGKRRSSGDWSSVIQAMIANGAPLDDAQARQAHDYLAANFAPRTGRPSTTSAPVASAVPVGGTTIGTAQTYPRPEGPSQWPAYGGGNANQNYSPLAQITPANVGKLKQAWAYHYGAGIVPQGDQGLDYRFEVTPLLIGGVMYISTPSSPAKPDLKSTVTALRPETGEVIWRFESPANIHGRGIAYWPGDTQTAPRLIFATDGGLIMAVDVTTGRLARGFGWGGKVDAYIGVASEIVGENRRDTYTVPNPVSIWKNLIITGSRPGEVGPPGPRGDIRAFDARTGQLVWDFHTIPQPGEPGHEQYVGDEWKGLSGANVWSTMSVDDQAGVIYATTGDANAADSVRGNELYSSSLLAIDAATGKLKWYHQITHHDVWDWDSPTPIVLLDYQKDGQTIPALAMTGKHSLFFLFDRRDGTPLNGFSEKPTPQPPVPNPEIWATQPFPDAPGPLARTTMTRDEVPDLAPGMKQACQATWDKYHTTSDPLYAPRRASDHAVITYPSAVGGPNWGGGSYLPDRHLFVINVQNRATFQLPSTGPQVGMHGSPPPPDDGQRIAASSSGGAGAGGRRGGRPPNPFSFTTKDGINLSCGATPWGELVAVDVQAKRIAWRVPLGETEGIGPKGLSIGTSNLGGSMATKSGLIFIGATNDRRFRAFDARSGKKLWETTMDASGASTPISYVGKDGKQYVVLAAGGGTSVGQKVMSDALVAYRLP